MSAVLAGITLFDLVVLSTVARSTFGWEVAVALHLPGGLQAAAQWVLAAGAGVLGATAVRRGLEHARGDRTGGVVGTSLHALVASFAFFAAIELARAAL